MTPEGKIKAKVKKMLADYPVWTHWPVQMGYGAPTLDCVGTFNGKFFAIETKAPGEKPTPRQEITIKEMLTAGGAVFVIDGRPSHMLRLLLWLEEVSQQGEALEQFCDWLETLDERHAETSEGGT